MYSFPSVYGVGRSWYYLPYPDAETESLRVFSDFVVVVGEICFEEQVRRFGSGSREGRGGTEGIE